MHPSGVIAGVGHRKPGKMKLDENVAYLEVPGSVISTMKQSRVRKLMIALKEECEFKCTRTDVAVDDYAKTFDVRTVAKAKDKYHYTGFGNTGRFGIEEMFRDFKSGGYNLEGTKVSDKRLMTLILLITLANCSSYFMWRNYQK